MRIVGGSLRGRRFLPVGNFGSRPTTDIAKESLFNVLSNIVYFEDIKVLDLFSGTGSISFEFASRGCPDVTSVEIGYNYQQYILKMVIEFGMQKVIRSLRSDAFRYVAKTEEKFDIVFADPPFNLAEVDTLPDLVINHNIINKGGMFILEHSGEGRFNNHPNFLQTRTYGKVNFTFFGEKE